MINAKGEHQADKVDIKYSLLIQKIYRQNIGKTSENLFRILLQIVKTDENLGIMKLP